MKYLRKLRLLVSGLLFFLLVLIVMNLASIRERISDLDTGSQTGPIWYITGIELDLLQLELTLNAYTNGRASPSDVNLRFDILWSRLEGVQKGDTARKLAEYQIDTRPIEGLLTLFRSNEELILNLPQQLLSSTDVRIFMVKIGAYKPQMRNLSLDVLRDSSKESQNSRENLSIINSQNAFLISLVLGVLLVLVLLQIFDNLQTRRALREKERLLTDATAANLAKSQFISVMNHELRTPLTSIRGAISLLNAGAAGEFSEKGKKLLDMAQRNSEHLTSLVEDILDIEKLAAGQFDIYLETLDIVALIEEDMSSFISYGKSYGVTTTLESEAGISKVEVDPKRMRQVILNLVSNAIKFSGSSDVVRIGIKQSAGSVIISVSDSGIGIPEASLNNIFDPFFQVDASDTRNIGGTGLGLNITKSFLKAMGCKISVESTLGKGTTFLVTIPV